jgi:zona occludens toxin
VIVLYEGTPGSGKSFHAINDIFRILQRGINVIANFPVDVDKIKEISKSKKMGQFVYVSNQNLTVDYLYKFAMANHDIGKEGQTRLFIDECQVKFNPRDYRNKDRMDFILFFSQHRKLGYNVTLITQMDRLIDRQIRGCIEYRVKHRKVNNFGTFGMFIPITVFAAVEYWNGINQKIGSTMIVYKKKIAQLYDSYALFDDITDTSKIDKRAVETINVMKEKKELKKSNKKKVNLTIKKIKYLRFILNLRKGVLSWMK